MVAKANYNGIRSRVSVLVIFAKLEKSKSFISVLNKGCCAENGGFGLLLIEWVFEDRDRVAFLIIMVTLIKIKITFLITRYF